jgi:hypothetical protein
MGREVKKKNFEEFAGLRVEDQKIKIFNKKLPKIANFCQKNDIFLLKIRQKWQIFFPKNAFFIVVPKKGARILRVE